MSKPAANWVYPTELDLTPNFIAACNDDALIAQLMWQRGIRTPAAAKSYLNPALYTPASHWDLPDMQAGVDCIKAAIEAQKAICVWGDFDADGQTSAALLVSVLRTLNANVRYYIPNRQRESHGIKISSLEAQIAAGAQVILTCDTGISEVDAIAYARSVGVDVVVTDHHTIPAQLPPANANINPQRLPPDHPARTLPGVGAAYLFANALGEAYGFTGIADPHLDLVAIGIVADVATQTGDCRYLLQIGLEALRTTQRAGLHALLATADLNQSALTATDIGFGLGPRLNALGRLGDATYAVQLLITENATLAKQLADQIEQLNQQRKHITEQIYNSAIRQIETAPHVLTRDVLVLAHEKWESGVTGLVASRLVGDYQRPVILLVSGKDGISRGSARSVSGCNITEAIRSCADILIGFGGHPMAAGVSLQTAAVATFAQQVAFAAAQQPEFDAKTATEVQIDAIVPLVTLTPDYYQRLQQLAPFGAGNREIQLVSEDVQIASQRPMGREQQHRRLTLSDSTAAEATAVWWRSKDSPLPEGTFSLHYTLGLNTYRGNTSLQLTWQSVQAATLAEATKKERYTIHDQRNQAVAIAKLPAGTLVWNESQLPPTGVNRSALQACVHLIIASCPPTQAVLQSVLATTQPATITVTAAPASKIVLTAYLQRLQGLLKTVTVKFDGEIAVEKIAGLMNSDPKTVALGLQLLEHQGLFTSVILGETVTTRLGATKILRPGTADIRTRLSARLNEENAFRKYFMHADLHNFFNNL